MEAGNRCFDMRVPEEINRRIVDHTADINLTYSAIAREYLLREGLPADRVIKTGSPMQEVLSHYRSGIEASDVLERLALEAGRFFLGERASRREYRAGWQLRKACRHAEHYCIRVRPADHRVHASPYTQAGSTMRESVLRAMSGC